MPRTVAGLAAERRRNGATKRLALLAHGSRPAITRLRMIDLSCSPKTDAIWIMARPIGVALSIAC